MRFGRAIVLWVNDVICEVNFCSWIHGVEAVGARNVSGRMVRDALSRWLLRILWGFHRREAWWHRLVSWIHGLLLSRRLVLSWWELRRSHHISSRTTLTRWERRWRAKVVVGRAVTRWKIWRWHTWWWHAWRRPRVVNWLLHWCRVIIHRIR